MSTFARRASYRTLHAPRAPTRQVRRAYADSAPEEQKNVLKEGARRDPELYVHPPP